MSFSNRSRRFIPSADPLPSRITPSTGEVCPMDPILIDYRLPENNPIEVDPMAPLHVEVAAELSVTVSY